MAGTVYVKIEADAEFLRESLKGILVEFTDWLEDEQFTFGDLDFPDEYEELEGDQIVDEFLAYRDAQKIHPDQLRLF